jgi:REP element-mobilizing transposase RayT
MGRVRKRHIQTELDLKRDKNDQRRGGRRPGAGRKPVGRRAGVAHVTRVEVDPRKPRHVTLRVVPELGWLRKLDMFAAIRRALRVAKTHFNEFRIVHISVQNTHLHLICEASSKDALRRGLQSFQISAAKRLNAAFSARRRLRLRRRGRVFADRYHAETLETPTQVRNAIGYVLNNWRRHAVDRTEVFTLANGRLDPYASGMFFAGWRDWLRANPIVLPRDYEPPLLSKAGSWLLRAGWQKAKSVGMFDRPGPRTVASHR